MPSVSLSVLALDPAAALGAPAALVRSSGPGAALDPVTRLAIRFGVAFALNLLLGGGLVVLAPTYARTTVNRVRSDPGSAFVWGLIVGVGVPIVLVLLAITIIGLVVTIPGLIVLAIVGLVGNAVTIVWIGETVAGRSDGAIGGRTALLGALALALPAAIPVVGNFLVTVLGFFGLGAVGERLYESWAG